MVKDMLNDYFRFKPHEHRAIVLNPRLKEHDELIIKMQVAPGGLFTEVTYNIDSL